MGSRRTSHRAGCPAPGAQQVMVIRDPEDTPATQQLLRTLNDPDRGILVIGAMPYINSPRDLACCVFDALGKDMHRYKNGNLPGQAWDSAVAWTRAYRLHTVVVNRAHTLPSGLYDHLRELLLPDGPRLARLVLIDSSSAKRYTVIDRFRALRSSSTATSAGCRASGTPLRASARSGPGWRSPTTCSESS